MTFAEKIKSLRKERGLTQMKLAAATNVSLGVIADIESGRRDPSKEVAKRFADYFKVPIQTFILEDAPIAQATAKPVDTATVLMIADIVAEYLQKNGYQLTHEQRAALIDHFYRMNVNEPEEIKRMLSVMVDVFLLKR